ncbi:MAG: PH domain-containing protein [Pseudoclavibacter sp.]|nr:PH domain-containing protein [Pseudoclavibacter sp.]
MNDTTVLRPRFSRFLYLGVMACCALALGSALVPPAPLDRIAQIAALPAALAGVGWVTLFAPCVAVGPRGIEIRNPLRTTRIGHGAVRDVDTRHGLSVITEDGRHQAWGAPPPSRLQGLGDLLSRRPRDRGRDRELRDPRIRRDADAVRSSALPGTDSGDAAMAVAHYADATDPEAWSGVERRWNRGSLLLLAASLAAALLLSTL